MRAVDRWELGAEPWVQLVRDGGDATFAWNSAAFLKLVPAPGNPTVDVGSGEAARVLVPGRLLCFSIVHPIATASILEEHGDAPRFVLERAYCEPAAVERPLDAGAVVQYHRPIAWCAEALEVAGFRVEALREIPTRRKAPAGSRCSSTSVRGASSDTLAAAGGRSSTGAWRGHRSPSVPGDTPAGMTLRDVWDRQADQWTRFVRCPAGGRRYTPASYVRALEAGGLGLELLLEPPAAAQRRLPIRDRIPLFLMWRAAKL
jgi:hypothetical protein